MYYILAGLLGFLAVLLSDVADLWKARLVEKMLRLGGIALVICSFLVLGTGPERLQVPPWTRIAGAALFLPSFLLWASSLFSEIPPKGSRGPERLPRLVSTGNYALCRHPGVLWLLSLHIGLLFATASRGLLEALPFWTGANLVLVGLEDLFLFPRLFGEAYSEYRLTVPFLLPSRASLRRCIATFSLPTLGRRDPSGEGGDKGKKASK